MMSSILHSIVLENSVPEILILHIQKKEERERATL